MENISKLGKQDEAFELPPGFRFHPTDEELITHYLNQKVHDSCFSARAIGEVDLNKCEPWDLPRRAKMGEKEWYFFCLRDRKYPTGLRTNRATEAGYWKATGKDKEIFKAKTLIGMKKTLVFYKGRAPKGEKTNWVMHEYRVESKFSVCNLPKTAENVWVLCRVFQKSSDRKKSYIPGLVMLSSIAKDLPLSSSLMPPLMESSPYTIKTKTPAGEFSHVTCFSDLNPAEDQGVQDDVVDSLEAPFMASSSSASWGFLNSAPNSSCQSPQMEGQNLNSQHPDGFLMQNQSMLRMLIEDNETHTKQSGKTGFSQESDRFGADISSIIYQERPSASAGPVDIGRLWDYRY